MPLFYKQTSGISSGRYRIKTCGHREGNQPPGWELSAWHGDAADKRSDVSSWVAVHSADARGGGGRWSSDWSIVPGSRTGTYRIKTCGHREGNQPPGWELSAWRGDAADERNGWSSWVAVHSADAQGGGGKWGSDWSIEPGSRPGTYRIKTCGHSEGNQPPGWELSAWHGDAADKRSDVSSWVAVHSADASYGGGRWGSDWELQRLGD